MLRNQRRFRTGALLATLALALAAPSAAWAGGSGEKNGRFEAGAPGVGDPYYPLYGNGGYQARHYTLDIKYDPASNHLDGRATIYATATNDLFRFNLDLVGLTVNSITVNGKSAEWSRTEHELIITPQRKLKDSEYFTVAINYGGVPKTFQLPGTNLETGFMHTDDGAVVAGQPQVAAAWYPVNDHPLDKASYSFNVAVPAGLEAISNGRLLDTVTENGWSTWKWLATEPMASYLATATIGQFELRKYTTDQGLPAIDAIDPDLGDLAKNAITKEDEVLAFLETQFGGYPFHALGGIVDDYEKLGFALENQTRPIYAEGFFEKGDNPGEVFVIAHELAHQWAGDSSSVYYWKDLWLNEGFATYAEWLWSEHTHNESAQKIFDFYYVQPEDRGYWSPPPGDPGKEHLFDSSVYTRSAMTLHALRMTIGDEDFFDLLKAWFEQQQGGNHKTSEFIALAEKVSGQQLDELFNDWLFEEGKPSYPGGSQAAPQASTMSAQDPPLAVRSLHERVESGHRF